MDKSNMNVFVVSPEEKGQRIDKFVAKKLGEEYSRVFAKMLIEKGEVKVNGDTVKPSFAVSEGDTIDINIVAKPETRLTAEDIPLDIIFEDDFIIVVNKPAGLVVHPGAGNKSGTFANALLFHSKKLAGDAAGVRPGILHRLDKDTSGVIIAVKDDKSLRFLANQFKTRRVGKKYIALVKGVVQEDNGIITAPIGRDKKNREKMVVSPEDGQTAITEFHVLKRFERFTVLRVSISSGRTHQIRVHMSHLGYPILGDKVYGRGADTDRQMLHAESIKVIHPSTKEPMEFKAEIPDDMMNVIKHGDYQG
ncbi:MAG: RluA family pseudouridine synthase [Candidatus Omnitrophica bacterium]|nr:RluA family pseudouridine synthase [Candidatus Omnitrophota bacterium]